MSLIHTHAIGRIGKDAVVRAIDNGDKVISFNIAIDQGTKDNPRTLWVTCSYWRRAGESTEVANFLKTGTQVYVEGTPGARPWQAQDGTLNASLELTTYKIKLLGSPNKDGQQQGQSQAQTTQAQPAQNQTAYTPPRPVAQAAPQPTYVQPSAGAHNPDDDLPF